VFAWMKSQEEKKALKVVKTRLKILKNKKNFLRKLSLIGYSLIG